MAMYPSAPEDLNWRASSTCDGGACVRVARDGDSVVFGSTTEPNGPVYAYAWAEWKEFVAGVKRGDFDDIA
jgi:hypothetical protein